MADAEPLDGPMPAPSAWSEAAELVHRIRRGDAEAEEEFIQRYRRGVKVIVARASRDRSMVDDLCQDVLTIALEKIRAGAIREAERLSGFVAGLARTLVVEHFRKVSARGAIEARLPPPPKVVTPTAVDDLVQQDRAAVVRAVLAELDSDRDRQILFRYYLEEDDKEEICRDLGLTSLHFNRVLFRARERYRLLYRQWVESRGLGDGPR